MALLCIYYSNKFGSAVSGCCCCCCLLEAMTDKCLSSLSSWTNKQNKFHCSRGQIAHEFIHSSHLPSFCDFLLNFRPSVCSPSHREKERRRRGKNWHWKRRSIRIHMYIRSAGRLHQNNSFVHKFIIILKDMTSTHFSVCLSILFLSSSLS